MIDKGIRYEVQGGVKNYLGKQKEVKAPVKWKSSPDHPETELAYITKKEKDLLIKSDLHGSLKGSVNRGPSGIISLNGWGDASDGFGGGTPGPGDTGGEGGNSPQDNSTSQFGGGSPSTSGDGGNTREQYSVTRTTTPKDKEVKVGPTGPVERDTELEKQRKLNEEILDKFKKTRPDINVPEWSIFTKILENPLQKFSDWTTAKNRQLFEDVIRAGNIPGLNFANLTDIDIEKAYQDYMDDRLSGKTDAYGREINRDQGDQGVSGILQNLLMPLAPILESQEGINSIPSQSFNYAYTPDRRIVIAPGTALGRAKITI